MNALLSRARASRNTLFLPALLVGPVQFLVAACVRG